MSSSQARCGSPAARETRRRAPGDSAVIRARRSGTPGVGVVSGQAATSRPSPTSGPAAGRRRAAGAGAGRAHVPREHALETAHALRGADEIVGADRASQAAERAAAKPSGPSGSSSAPVETLARADQPPDRRGHALPAPALPLPSARRRPAAQPCGRARRSAASAAVRAPRPPSGRAASASGRRPGRARRPSSRQLRSPHAAGAAAVDQALRARHRPARTAGRARTTSGSRRRSSGHSPERASRGRTDAAAPGHRRTRPSTTPGSRRSRARRRRHEPRQVRRSGRVHPPAGRRGAHRLCAASATSRNADGVAEPDPLGAPHDDGLAVHRAECGSGARVAVRAAPGRRAASRTPPAARRQGRCRRHGRPGCPAGCAGGPPPRRRGAPGPPASRTSTVSLRTDTYDGRSARPSRTTASQPACLSSAAQPPRHARSPGPSRSRRRPRRRPCARTREYGSRPAPRQRGRGDSRWAHAPTRGVRLEEQAHGETAAAHVVARVPLRRHARHSRRKVDAEDLEAAEASRRVTPPAPPAGEARTPDTRGTSRRRRACVQALLLDVRERHRVLGAHRHAPGRRRRACTCARSPCARPPTGRPRADLDAGAAADAPLRVHHRPVVAAATQRLGGAQRHAQRVLTLAAGHRDRAHRAVHAAHDRHERGTGCTRRGCAASTPARSSHSPCTSQRRRAAVCAGDGATGSASPRPATVLAAVLTDRSPLAGHLHVGTRPPPRSSRPRPPPARDPARAATYPTGWHIA